MSEQSDKPMNASDGNESTDDSDFESEEWEKAPVAFHNILLNNEDELQLEFFFDTNIFAMETVKLAQDLDDLCFMFTRNASIAGGGMILFQCFMKDQLEIEFHGDNIETARLRIGPVLSHRTGNRSIRSQGSQDSSNYPLDVIRIFVRNVVGVPIDEIRGDYQSFAVLPLKSNDNELSLKTKKIVNWLTNWLFSTFSGILKHRFLENDKLKNNHAKKTQQGDISKTSEIFREEETNVISSTSGEPGTIPSQNVEKNKVQRGNPCKSSTVKTTIQDDIWPANIPESESRLIRDFKINFGTCLGAGSNGIVYTAENRYDRSKYAVKKIKIDRSDITIETSLREVRAMSKLDHPGIIRYYSTWMEGLETKHELLYLYIQMQLCDSSLERWLYDNQTQTSRDIPQMKSWFIQMVSAIAYVHGKGIAHRDLKPSNILFVEKNWLKVCDLGIAVELRGEDGNLSAVRRTPQRGSYLYASYEQKNHKTYDEKTDIFSLGLIFAEMCVPMSSGVTDPVGSRNIYPPPLTIAEKQEIFDSYRSGEDTQLPHANRLTAEFVELLAQKYPVGRPTCLEILDHDFLADADGAPCRYCRKKEIKSIEPVQEVEEEEEDFR